MSFGYSSKASSYYTPSTYKQTNLTKTQPQIVSKFLQVDHIYQFTKTDEDHLKYLQDRFLNDKQVNISTNSAWMFKDQRDFRYKIYNLINHIANKKNNQNQEQNLINERDFYLTKGNLFQDLLERLFQDLKQMKFNQTIGILQSKQFQYYSTLVNQVKKYTRQLNQLQKINDKEELLRQKQYELSIYKTIIDSTDNHSKLVHFVSQYQKLKIFNESTMQKLLTLTSKLGQYQQSSKQNSSNKWLKHFLAILSQNFDQHKILSLENSVNNQPNNTELKKIMQTLKIFCLKRGKQVNFMEKLKKMTINNYNTVLQVYDDIRNTSQSNLKNKLEDMFAKQLAIKIIENQNLKNLNKNESYTRKLCNQYFQMMNNKGYQVSYLEKQLSQLLDIKEKLFKLEQIIGSNQNNSWDKKKQTFQKNNDVLEQIRISIERMSNFLKGQNLKFQSNQSSLKKTQNPKNSNNSLFGKQILQNQPVLTNNISQKKIQQIFSLKNNIEEALKTFKRFASQKRQLISFKQTVSYHQVQSIYFKQFTQKLVLNMSRIQQILKPSLNQSSNSSRTQSMKQDSNNYNQNQLSKKSSQYISQINSLKQELKTFKSSSQKYLQEKNSLVNQLKKVQETAQIIKKQNVQLHRKQKEFERYYQQWRNQWQRLNNQIQQMKLTINLRDGQLIDLNSKLQNTKKQYELKQTNEILKLKNEIIQKQQQINTLNENLKNSKYQSLQKDSIISKKEQEIRGLVSQKNQLTFKIYQFEQKIKQKDTQVQITQNKLNQKLTQIQILNNKNNQNQNKIIESQKRIKQIQGLQKRINQLQKQNQKLASQKRVGNFRSFNTNARQKSVLKNTQTVKKNDPLLLKVPSTKSNTIKVPDQNKNLPQSQLNIQKKQDCSTQIQNTKLSLKLQTKILSQFFIPQLKNSKMKQFEHSLNENNEQHSFILENQKSLNVLNQKQSIINNLQKSIQRLTDQIKNLNSQFQEVSRKNQQNEKEVSKLIKSNEILRLQKTQYLNFESNFQTLKKQNQQTQNKYQQALRELQKYKQIVQEKEKDSLQQNSLQKIQKQLIDKNNLISQKQENINDLSNKVDHLISQKITLQKIIQSLKNQQKETVLKYEQKLKVKPVTEQNKPKQENINKFEAQKKQMKMKILSLELDLQEKIQHYDDLNTKYKKQTTKLKDQIQSLNSIKPEFQSQINSLKTTLSQKQQAFKSKEKDIQNLNNKIVQLQAFIQKQKQDNKKFEQEITQLKKENESVEKQLTRLNGERNNFQSENNNLKDKLRNERNLHKQEIDKMKKDQALQIKNIRLQCARKMQEERRQAKSIQYFQRVKSTTDTSGQSNVLMKMEFQKLKKEFQMEEKSNQKLKQNIKDLKNQIMLLTNQIQNKEKQLKQAKNKVTQMKSSMKQLENTLVPFVGGIKQISTVIYDRFFQNQALYQQFYKKYLIYDLIQQKTKKTINSTILLYRLDFQNKINFHNYIDTKQNVIAIIKLSNGNIFGCFSTSKLQKGYKEPVGTISFIFTFDQSNNIEHFNMDKKKNLNIRGFDWDEYFFVFGNAEIRWRFGQNKIYSNFGINNAYFETKGKDVSVLLKQGNSREVFIQALDFYQVVFEE